MANMFQDHFIDGTEDVFRNASAAYEEPPYQNRSLTIYLTSALVAVCYLLASIVCCRCYFQHLKKSSTGPDDFKPELPPSTSAGLGSRSIDSNENDDDDEDDDDDDEDDDEDEEDEEEDEAEGGGGGGGGRGGGGGGGNETKIDVTSDQNQTRTSEQFDNTDIPEICIDKCDNRESTRC